jgi:hypothetical protein
VEEGEDEEGEDEEDEEDEDEDEEEGEGKEEGNDLRIRTLFLIDLLRNGIMLLIGRLLFRYPSVHHLPS